MSSRQNPLHLSSCYYWLSLFGGGISLFSVLCHYRCPGAISLYYSVSCTSMTTILKWSSTILTVTHLIAYSIMKYHDISYISP